MDRRKILLLSCILFLALTLLSWLGFFFRGISTVPILTHGRPLGVQFMLGLVVGALISGTGMVLVLGSNLLRKYRNIVVAILADIKPKIGDLVFISLGAGWSEELFFRGFLQPWIGIGWASILFWLAHGAFSTTSWGINLYGLCVLVAGIGLGYLYESQGLVAAMTAHAALDATTLLGFHFWMKTQGLYLRPDRFAVDETRDDHQTILEETSDD